MKHAIGISVVALVALTACQKKAETTSVTKPTAEASAPTSAGPLTPPARKPGLWAQTVSTAQMQQSTKLCLDAATERQMAWWSSQAAKSKCAEQKISQQAGGSWAFHSVCTSPSSGTTTSDGTARGDFGSHYKVEATSVTTGGPMPQANGTHKIAIEATWEGPCPSGMKPGDMEMPGGMRINVNDAMSGKGPSGMPQGHVPSAAEIAKLRAQAKAMEAATHQAQ
jgi:hypothetical protein